MLQFTIFLLQYCYQFYCWQSYYQSAIQSMWLVKRQYYIFQWVLIKTCYFLFWHLGSSERWCISDLILTISFPIFFDSWCFFSLNCFNSPLCCSKVRSDLATFSWSLVSKGYFYINGEGEVGIFVDSVEIVMFSVDPDCMFVVEDITRNISFGF